MIILDNFDLRYRNPFKGGLELSSLLWEVNNFKGPLKENNKCLPERFDCSALQNRGRDQKPLQLISSTF